MKRRSCAGTSQPGFSLTAQANAYNGALMALPRHGWRARSPPSARRSQEAQGAAASEQGWAVREAEIDRQRDLGQLEGRVEELAEELAELRERLAEETGSP